MRLQIRARKIDYLIVIFIFFLCQGCYLLGNDVVEENLSEQESKADIVLQGHFKDADEKHKGSGIAQIHKGRNGGSFLHLGDFSVTNGPDLRVKLSPHSSPSSRANIGKETIDLGPLKGNVGNQIYQIPSNTDISDIQSVVIYCESFEVIFSVASLSSIDE